MKNVSVSEGVFSPLFDTAFDEADALIAEQIEARRDNGRDLRPLIIGFSGPQGSGKSSTAQRLAARLENGGLAVAVRSLDDFYLRREDRAVLGNTEHPLLTTRGVPGTHDLALLDDIIARLTQAGQDSLTALPSFDKTIDDRAPKAHWPVFRGRPDIILLEGWCIGARPQPAHALRGSVNALEEVEDVDGVWRNYVNDQLADGYARLHRRLDFTVMLRAPSFECVYGWRAEQEAKLARSDGSNAPMTKEQLGRFIAHYERLTRWLMEDAPADLVIDIASDRKPLRWHIRNKINGL